MASDLKLEKEAGSLDGSTPSQHDSQDATKEGFVVAESPIEVSGKGDLDIAAEFLKLHEGEHGEYTEAEAKKVLFKIDIWIIPMLLITITLAAVDKIIISNAALYGMKTDTHLVGQEYSWVGSIFYFGYLVSEFPTNALIQKLPIGRFLGATTIIWSATVMLMGATNNAAGLMTLRFFMGVLEAPVFPVCSVMTVMWYKKQEQPLRVALWLSGFSSLFAGIVSYGIGHTSTKVAPWRLLFIVLGGASLLWGVFLYLFLPDSPLSAHFLDDRQKYIAVHRIKGNMTGIENKKLKWYQVREAFTDWKTWPLVIYCFCINIANGGLVTFAAQIVSGLGYSALRTTLLGMPTGVMMTGSALVVSIPASQFKNMRCISAATCAIIPLTCCILMMKLPKENKKGLLAAYYCFYCYWGGYPTVTSIPLANTSGHTKKVTRNALMFLSYCVGNIVAPQFFITAEAPGYKTGYRAILGSLSIAIVALLGYAAGVRYENKRTLMKLEGQEPGAQVAGDDVLADMTDKEKKGFVYVY